MEPQPTVHELFPEVIDCGAVRIHIFPKEFVDENLSQSQSLAKARPNKLPHLIESNIVVQENSFETKTVHGTVTFSLLETYRDKKPEEKVQMVIEKLKASLLAVRALNYNAVLYEENEIIIRRLDAADIHITVVGESIGHEATFTLTMDITDQSADQYRRFKEFAIAWARIQSHIAHINRRSGAPIKDRDVVEFNDIYIGYTPEVSSVSKTEYVLMQEIEQLRAFGSSIIHLLDPKINFDFISIIESGLDNDAITKIVRNALSTARARRKDDDYTVSVTDEDLVQAFHNFDNKL